MKASFNKFDLTDAVITVQRAVSTKNTTNPALEGILFKVYGDSARLCGYDLEIGITTSIPATVIEEGEIVLEAKLLSDIVKRMPDDFITIETTENYSANISSGSGIVQYDIKGSSSYDYPELPSFDTLQKFDINAETLKSMVRDTLYAIGTNPNKPNLMGSFFDVDGGFLNVVSIDGIRMTLRKEPIECSESFNFIVPKKALNEITKITNEDESSFTIILGNKHIIFQVDGYSIISKLIEGSFINYKATIPTKTSTSLVINRKMLISSVERIALITNEKIKTPIHFLVADDGMKIFCRTTLGNAQDFIELDFEGNVVEIGFNSQYILDSLRNIDMDTVKFDFNGTFSPLKITPSDNSEKFVSIVLPMRI